MPAPILIFLDFNLPNPTTWFYFSFLLAMAAFFKFARLMSVRNLDVVMVFLLVPGLILVQAARPHPIPIEQQPAVQLTALIGQAALADAPGTLATPIARVVQQSGPALEAPLWLKYGYIWLLLGSVYFFCRCLFDLILVQRPALAPNLQMGGLAWLAGALLICLLAVAYRQVDRHLAPLPTNGQAAPLPQVHAPVEESVFAITILWRHWPTWAIAALAFACQVAVLVCLIVIGWRHFQDLPAGMAAGTFYLMLPYTGLQVGQIQHVLPMALFLGAIVAYRSPTLAGFILGLAAAATYFPVFVLPLWLSFYRGCGMGRFLGAFLAAMTIFLANLALTLSLHDQLTPSLQMALDSAAWQPWKIPPASTEGFWTGLHWAYRIPVFLVFLSFVGVTMFWPTPKNLAHVIALSAAMFISLQWWCADQGGTYVLWYLPLMLLLVFRPNMQDRVPPPIAAETDWLARSLEWGKRQFRRIFKRAQPAASSKT